MIKKIKQLLNSVNNGDLVGNNKIVNNNYGIKSKKFVEEIFDLIVLNFKSRVDLHTIVENTIFEINNSGNPFWLDETDFVIDQLFEDGKKIDNKINETLVSLKEISPRLHSMCLDYYNHEKSIRSSISGWLVCPNSSLKEQTGYAYPEIYIRCIKNMDENLQYINSEMDNFLMEY